MVRESAKPKAIAAAAAARGKRRSHARQATAPSGIYRNTLITTSRVTNRVHAWGQEWSRSARGSGRPANTKCQG